MAFSTPPAQDVSSALAEMEQRLNTVLIDPGCPDYPPCTAPLEDLNRVPLSHLCSDGQNTGCVAIVKCLTAPVQKWPAILFLAADSSGDIECIEAFNCDPTFGKDAMLAVKEPYSTACGIHVGHPTNLVPFPLHLRNPQDSREERTNEKTALEWKSIGNGLLKQKDTYGALRAYDEAILALRTNSDDDLERDVYRNRAQANLTLERFEAADEDAALSLCGDRTKDAKAHFRAASASYHLRKFEAAKMHLLRYLAVLPGDKMGLEQLRRVVKRLLEREGQYNFDDMISSQLNRRFDAADFTEKTVVRESEGRGRGLFAAEDLKLGDLILCGKAFCAVYEDERHGFAAQVLTWEVVFKVLRNPHLATVMNDLHGSATVSSSVELTEEGKIHVLNTHQIQKAINCNSFSLPVPDNADFEVFCCLRRLDRERVAKSAAVYHRASMFNHSCVGNAHESFLGDLIIVRATRDIKAGEEIFISYIGKPTSPDRNERFQRNWGFTCDCSLCAAEAVDKSVSERYALERTANELSQELAQNVESIDVDRLRAGGDHETKRLMKDGEDLLKKMKSSYDAEAYEAHGAPCQSMCGLRSQMAFACIASATPSAYAKMLSMAQYAFAELGWEINLNKGELRAKIRDCQVNEDALMLLLGAAKVKRRAGDVRVADKLQQIAEAMYRALNGVMNVSPLWSAMAR